MEEKLQHQNDVVGAAAALDGEAVLLENWTR